MYWEITKEGIARLREKNGDGISDVGEVVSKISRSWLTDEKADISASDGKAGIIAAFKDAFNSNGAESVAAAAVFLAIFIVCLLIAAVCIVTVNLRKNKK